jgi:hypothetical protein
MSDEEYIYDDNIGLETYNKEFKVFNFYSGGLEITNDDAITLIQNKKWIFNNYIMNNIKSMISSYLPKYTCAFLSTKIADPTALYFGIDDIGNIIGIPYQGELDIEEVKEYTTKILKENIKINNNNYTDLIDIKIIKVENNLKNEKIKSIHPDLKEFLKHNENYNLLKNKYRRKRHVWEKLSFRYNNKICELVNNTDTREELIKYIEHSDFNNSIIKLLKSDWKLKPFTFEDILYHKNNKNNIFYWVTEWKDKMLGFIKTIKPKLNYKFPTNIFPSTIIMLIKPMLAYWFNANQNMNLYLLKIEFKPHHEHVVQYKNIFNEWVSCVRTVNHNGPCCMPQYIDF